MVQAVEITIGKALPRSKEYDKQSTQRDFWRRSDKAGWDYAPGVNRQGAYDASGIWKILPQHERESQPRYNRRLSQAIARGYQRQILDRFSDHVYRIPANRPDVQGEYGILMDDADGAGTTLPALMKRALRKAQTEGTSYLLADSNVEQVFATKADEIAANKRGVITMVGADQVIWQRMWRGVVMEAIIVLSDRNGDNFALYVTEKFTQKIFLSAITENTNIKQVTVASVGPEIVHSYGGCPLVIIAPIFGEDDIPGDTSQGAPLAECIKRICNVDSWLYEETQGVTFTTQVFIGVAADLIKSLEVGPGSAVVLESQGASIDKLTADPAQAESLRATLDREITELYRAAGISGGAPTQVAQPESGVAKAFAFNEIEAKLTALAQSAQNSENLIVLRLSMGNGWAFPGAAQYPISFAMPDLVDELDYLIRITTASLPQVLEEKAIRQWAQTAFRLDKAEQAELNAQLIERENQKQIDQTTNPAGRNLGT